ncbi:MAG: response regulator [Vicinamibacterales bacterium]
MFAARGLPPVTQAASRPAVLVVDDVADTRKLLAQFLQRQGFDTLQAADGEEGLLALRGNRTRICTVVLDLIMGGMNGWTFRERQLADPSLASIPVVILTHARRSDLLRAALKVKDVLYKPVSSEELIAAIHRHCVGWGLNDAEQREI